MRLVLSEEEAALHATVGTDTLLRARTHIERGEVVDVRWQAETGRVEGRIQGPVSGSAHATMTTEADGAVAVVGGTCTCGLQPTCAHPVALVLLVLTTMPRSGVVKTVQVSPTVRVGPQTAQPAEKVPAGKVPAEQVRVQQVPARKVLARQAPAWEAAVAKLVGGPPGTPVEPVPVEADLALQFDLVEASTKPGAAPSWRVAIRPVVPGRTGWVRTGISWSTLNYTRYGRQAQSERHRRLLNEILMLSTAGNDRHYYDYHQQTVFLDGFSSRRIWDLLAEADETGLPLVQTVKGAAPVVVSRRPARMSMQAGRIGDELVLAPALAVDGVAVAPECALLVGRPAHGVVWWGVRGEPVPPPKDRVLRVGALAVPLEPGQDRMLAGPEIRVPAHDEERFLREFYPNLRRRFEVIAGDAVGLPSLDQATLTLAVDQLPGHQLALSWQWMLPTDGPRSGEPLYAPPPAGHADQRESLVRRVTAVVDAVPELLEPTAKGPRLAATATATGDAVIHLMNEVIPRLTELDGMDVVIHANGMSPDYREVYEAPAISFAGTDAVAEADWFDLAVRVSVDGEEVAFDELFVALAEDRRYLILPSGAYFSLDRPEFHQLRELIAEARALEDAPPGMLRVGRFQAGLWQELAELGEITGQARAWQEAVQRLAEAGEPVERPVPASLQAALRPYQRDGFGWLATLYDLGLGGILADDMGLGKTLQTLALICHIRESGAACAPFLVVAPASVVHNWVSEAGRFAPELTVRAVTQTEVGRGVELAEVAADADLVVTSYTLFRLEYDDYQALKWDGLILDEAQFIKNPHAQAHHCAKRLAAPFKLAITGTPMENNLTELWALCSVTAPGLFPRLDRFTDYYRNPIEKGRDTERLAQLRRRVRPLILRRRKADVVADLPDKQEQVIELELTPRHRKVYQTYLQRERQKVLGLLGDLEKNRFEIFRSLTLLRQASLDVALVDPKHHGVPSTKLDVLVEQVASLVAEGHRTLVFSQFTRFLTAARERLAGSGVQCCYLDGKTRNRAAVLAEFKDGDAPVFLISLKAGGFGLNLTEADYCILLDPWWNPATEAQAVDRVHRIGQTRNVMVYRLVAKDTIEEKVMALKARKAELFSSVLDGGDLASARLTATDIQALLE